MFLIPRLGRGGPRSGGEGQHSRMLTFWKPDWSNPPRLDVTVFHQSTPPQAGNPSLWNLSPQSSAATSNRNQARDENVAKFSPCGGVRVAGGEGEKQSWIFWSPSPPLRGPPLPRGEFAFWNHHCKTVYNINYTSKSYELIDFAIASTSLV